MIVERQADEFIPITITIESELEAEFLWYVLKMPYNAIDREYRGIYRCHSGLGYLMFKEFDRVFQPCNKKRLKVNDK
jgi:hypothetical protein